MKRNRNEKRKFVRKVERRVASLEEEISRTVAEESKGRTEEETMETVAEEADETPADVAEFVGVESSPESHGVGVAENIAIGNMDSQQRTNEEVVTGDNVSSFPVSDESTSGDDRPEELHIEAERNRFRLELVDLLKEENLTRNTSNRILRLFRSARPDLDLPIDRRTLLNAAAVTTDIKTRSEGKYYFGSLKSYLTSCLIYLPAGTNSITVQANVDGIPLFKSSNLQFWPILCRILKPFETYPFVVVLFCGPGKPDLDFFLNLFVIEINDLLSDGLSRGIYGNSEDKVMIHFSGFVCDTPARAFVKGCASHTGTFGCDKCKVRGVSISHRMTFLDLNAEKRTDQSFRNGKELSDVNHIVRPSPVLNITGLDSVNHFKLDYMHLVALGACRKYLSWLVKGPRTVRLSARQLDEISEHLISMNPFIPSCFQRKHRVIREAERWKATEARLFLLYTGPVVLKAILDRTLYGNFLLLSCGLRLLMTGTPGQREIQKANLLLRSFVEHACNKTLFGPEFGSYNIHGLSHIAEEVTDGPLESFSAFSYESFLGDLKKLVRSGNKPLQQVLGRLHEKGQLNSVSLIDRKCHFSKSTDRYFRLKDRETVFFVEDWKVGQPGRTGLATGYRLKSPSDLFDYPFASSDVHCSLYARRSPLESIDTAELGDQVFGLPYKKGSVVVWNLLHHSSG